MKKTALAFMLCAALVLSLSACGIVPPAETEAPAAEPQAKASARSDPATEAGRQDGERFEAVIMLEGMEETVQYAHIVNDTLGFEMDYDYERFTRIIEADREFFVSVLDDDIAPKNYLELTCSPEDAESVADAISASLSQEFDLIRDTRELDRAGSCIYIEASELKGTGTMADELQAVYIFPAADGCRVATAHFSIEAAEGFGRRIHYMMHTLSVINK